MQTECPSQGSHKKNTEAESKLRDGSRDRTRRPQLRATKKRPKDLEKSRAEIGPTIMKAISARTQQSDRVPSRGCHNSVLPQILDLKLLTAHRKNCHLLLGNQKNGEFD